MNSKLSSHWHNALGVAATSLLLVTTPGMSKEIGRFPAPDGSFQLVVESLPAAGRDEGLALNRLVSLQVRIFPAGTLLPPVASAAAAMAEPAGGAPHDGGAGAVVAGSGAPPMPAPVMGPPTASRYSALTFDARMPEHNHGMVVKPTVFETGPGVFRVDGVKLHMVGHWELSFAVSSGATPVKVVVPFEM
jgi:hypothetical protein